MDLSSVGDEIDAPGRMKHELSVHHLAAELERRLSHISLEQKKETAEKESNV